MTLFSEYPPTLLIVPHQQWRRGRSQGEIRWRLRWPPKYSHWCRQRKAAAHALCLYKQDDTSSWLVMLSLTGLDQVLCSSACAACVATEVGPAYLPGMCFALSKGGQKFVIKWCCESFNLSTYNCFSLKRLLWKKGHFSAQSCSSTKCITHCTETQVPISKSNLIKKGWQCCEKFDWHLHLTL